MIVRAFVFLLTGKMPIYFRKTAVFFKKMAVFRVKSPGIVASVRVFFVFLKLEFHPSYASAFMVTLKAEAYEG